MSKDSEEGIQRGAIGLVFTLMFFVEIGVFVDFLEQEGDVE